MQYPSYPYSQHKIPLQSSSPYSPLHSEHMPHKTQSNSHFPFSQHTLARKKLIPQSFTFQFQIMYLLINMRFPCRFLVKCCDPLSLQNSAFQYDKSITTSNNNARVKDGKVDFDEKLTVKVEVPFNSEKGSYEQRQYYIVVLLISDRRPDEKLVGRYKVNLAEVIEHGKHQYLDQYELSYCATKAKLAFRIENKEKKMKESGILKAQPETYLQKIEKSNKTNEQQEQKQTNQPQSQQIAEKQREGQNKADDKNSVVSQYASSEQLEQSNILKEVKMPFNEFASKKEIEGQSIEREKVEKDHEYVQGEENRKTQNKIEAGIEKIEEKLEEAENKDRILQNRNIAQNIKSEQLLEQQSNEITYEISKHPSQIQYSSILKSVQEPQPLIHPSKVVFSEEELVLSSVQILDDSRRQQSSSALSGQQYQVVITQAQKPDPKLEAKDRADNCVRGIEKENQMIERQAYIVEPQEKTQQLKSEDKYNSQAIVIPQSEQQKSQNIYADVCFEPENLIEEEIQVSQQTSNCQQERDEEQPDIEQLTAKCKQIQTNIKNAKIVPITLLILMLLILAIGQMLWIKNANQFD